MVCKLLLKVGTERLRFLRGHPVSHGMTTLCGAPQLRQLDCRFVPWWVSFGRECVSSTVSLLANLAGVLPLQCMYLGMVVHAVLPSDTGADVHILSIVC